MSFRKHSSAIDLTNLSANEFIFGDCGGNRIGLMPIAAMIDRKDSQVILIAGGIFANF